MEDEKRDDTEMASAKDESRALSHYGRVSPKDRRQHSGDMSAVELKACLQRLDWSQQQFARYSCVSLSAVKKWAQGRTKIPGPVAVLLHLLLEKYCA